MSSTLIIPVPPAKLARAAWARVIGLLLLGLVAAAALAFYGYQLHRVNSPLHDYKEAAAQYRMREKAIRSLRDMEAAWNRYLLDGSSSSLALTQADKQMVEMWGADAQQDKVLLGMVSAEQKWYAQTAQPLIEERKKIPAGQGLPEDFLAKYRNAPGLSLQENFEQAAEIPNVEAQIALFHYGDELYLLWLPFPVAALAIIGVIWLGIGAIRNVSYLRQAAENPEEEDDDEPPHAEGGAK